MTHYLLLFFLCSASHAEDGKEVAGFVRSASGTPARHAEVALLNAQQAILASTKTDDLGRFRFSGVPAGKYLLQVFADKSGARRIAIDVRQSSAENLEIALGPAPLHEEVTVTASLGSVERAEEVVQQVNTIDENQINERAKAIVAQVALEEPGVHLQRTSPTIAGIHIRGLAGNKVNVFVDGVRFSTSAMRGGISTFFNLLEPSGIQAVEILRGPASAQYGSDALGGSIQILSRAPSFATGRAHAHGSLGTFLNSADASGGTALTTSYGAQNFGIITTLAAKRMNRLLTGQGLDSHSALTRFLGLPSNVIGDGRLQDSAFTQYGGSTRIHWAPDARSQLIFHYNRSQQDGGKRCDQLLGGDGNLVADLRNLMLDLFYVKLDRLNPGWFDDFTVSYSFNAQREERVNQGGNGNPAAPIDHDYERTGVHGIQSSLSKQWKQGQSLIFGGEYHQEIMQSSSFSFDPIHNLSAPERPRVPDHARFRTGGGYARNSINLWPGKLRLTASLRYSAASYRARALDSPTVGGRRLWPDDELTASAFAFSAGIAGTPSQSLRLSLNVSRGFRVPNMTDLGSLGLVGSGFEVAAGDIAAAQGTIGSTADAQAVSTGRPVTQVKPESSLTYEAGAGFRSARLAADFSAFVNKINDSISKQALILPPGALGRRLGGQTIVAQSSSGVVFVPASPSPVLARANLGSARILGFEHSLRYQILNNWLLNSGYTYLHARDQMTGLPPNIEGGTPPPAGYFKVRYHSKSNRFWLEPYVHGAYRQSRLSSLALEDRRAGAKRSRASIANFFGNGATARGLVAPGPDGAFGTGDDALRATGETLLQVQDRVLGLGQDSGVLFKAIPGYLTFNLRGGFRLAETHEFLIDFENIADRNYRGMSWGMDAPGRSVFFRYTKYY